MSRRPKGTGGAYFDKNRKVWVGTLDLGRDATGKRVRRSVTGRTKTDAQRKLADLKREIEQGPVGPARMTVFDLVRKWLERGLPPQIRSQNTRDVLRFYVDKLIVPYVGARRLRDLSCDDVDRWLDALIEHGYSRSTVAGAHSTLTRAIRWGERRGYAGRNVSALCDTPEGRQKNPSRALNEAQAREVLTACEGHPLGALVVVGLLMGLRPGELAGLPWECIDFESRTLEVRQALIRTNDSVLSIGAPKTKASLRVLRMPAKVAEMLQVRRRVQMADRMAAGSAWDNEHGLAFTTTLGTPLDPANVRRSFQQITTSAGVGGDWSPRELRHSAASLMAAAGLPIQHVADQLGHATLRMAGERYRHRIVDVCEAAVEPMDRLTGAG